jgi:hypothetical protein
MRIAVFAAPLFPPLHGSPEMLATPTGRV